MMLPRMFGTTLRMSVTASVVIVAVLGIRLLLRCVPKIFSYALWAVVLFRLLSPVFFEAPFGVTGVVDGEYLFSERSVSVTDAVGADDQAVRDAMGGEADTQGVRTAKADRGGVSVA